MKFVKHITAKKILLVYNKITSSGMTKATLVLFDPIACKQSLTLETIMKK